MNGQAIIETEELTKLYGQEVAVDHLTFQVNEGEIFGFLGPNGAGKTTTLLMLLGLTEPTSGKVRVLDVEPTRDPVRVKSLIGYLAENMGFYGDLDAQETLRFVARLNKLSDDVALPRMENALKTVGLYNEVNKKLRAYSRGMRQRLGIAELLVKEPKVVFLDEPTMGLDPDATNRMVDLIETLSRDNRMTVLLSSHQLQQVQRICHRVGIMIKGKMLTVGPMEQLAREKLGVGTDKYTLEEIYMKFFQEA